MNSNADTLAKYFELEKRPNGLWFARLDLRQARKYLDEDILVGLCRLLVGCDRLDTCHRFLHELGNGKRSDHPSSNSDRMNLFLFAVGTLKETAKAAGILTEAGIGKYLTEIGKNNWAVIRKILQKWNNDSQIKYVRNNMAFHFKDQIVRKGIGDLCSGPEMVGFASGVGENPIDMRMELGTATLLAGCEIEQSEFIELFKLMADEHLRMPSMIYHLVSEIRLIP